MAWMLLLGIVSGFAEDVTVSPSLEVNFRTATGNTGWQSGFPKDASVEGNTLMEGNYFNGLFVLQKYTVANLQNATKLVLTLTNSGASATIAWLYPNNNWTAASGIDDLLTNVTNAVGFAPRSTEGTKNTPLAEASKVSGSDPEQGRLTISGDALATLKAAAVDGTFTLLITDKALTSNSSRKFYSTNTANAENLRPTLVATVEVPKVVNVTTGTGYSKLEDAVTAATNGQTLQINEDLNLTGRCTLATADATVNIIAAKDVTITGPKNAMWFLANKSGAVLNIGDENHTITLDGRSSTNEQIRSVAKYENSAKVTLTNVKFQNFKLTKDNTTIPGLTDTHASDGLITLNNVTVSNCSAAEGGALFMKTRPNNDRMVLKGFLNIDTDCSGTAIYVASETKSDGVKGRIKIDDNNFTASNTITLEWVGDKAAGVVVAIGTTASNYAKFQLTDEAWTLTRKSNGDLIMAAPVTPTVKIGDKTYADLVEAAAAAADGDVLTLLDNQELKARLDVKAKSITVKGEGKTIKRAADYNGIVLLTASGDTPAGLTLENVILEGHANATAAFIEAGNKGTTTLKDVTFKNEVTTASAVIINKAGGKLVLQGTVAIPSVFIGKGLVVTATDATVSAPITLVTDNGTTYGLLVEGGKAADFTCSTFRLSQQQNGIYTMPLAVAHEYAHPALLHTNADIEAVKTRLTSNDAMINAAYTQLEAASAGKAAGAVEYLKRMDQKNWEATYPDYNNFTYAATDAKLAYHLALRYQLKGNSANADAAIAILNDWAKNNKGFLRLTRKDDGTAYANSIPDPNEYLMTIQAYQFANAAELLQGYSGWQAADQENFKNWIRQTFADVAILFLENHHNNSNAKHYWMNWDLAALNALLSVGILCNDQALVDYALAYPAKTDETAGTGTYANGIVATHTDAATGETLAQCQESGRDQGHATLDVTLLGVLCRTAQNSGANTDLFTNYKALEMAEYVGKYNLKNAAGEFVYTDNDVPFTAYSNGEVEHTAISADARGTERPCWELFLAYAKQSNKAAAYVTEWVKYLRQKNAGGECAPESNDELGFGTLMFSTANDIPTGIAEMKTLSNGENETFYDLQGRRVAQPTRGLYIVNGKKVVLK